MKNKYERDRQLEWLRAHIKKPIVLVGMMATGKSQLGARLAHALVFPFTDSDAEIERRAGCSVAEVFVRDGEDRFRAAEEKVIADLLRQPQPHVIATGGGAITRPTTLAAIKARGISIWLDADPATILSRVRDVTTRPLLNQPDPAIALENLLQARMDLYKQADLHIMAMNEKMHQTLDQVVETLYAHLKG